MQVFLFCVSSASSRSPLLYFFPLFYFPFLSSLLPHPTVLKVSYFNRVSGGWMCEVLHYSLTVPRRHWTHTGRSTAIKSHFNHVIMSFLFPSCFPLLSLSLAPSLLAVGQFCGQESAPVPRLSASMGEALFLLPRPLFPPPPPPSLPPLPPLHSSTSKTSLHTTGCQSESSTRTTDTV